MNLKSKKLATLLVLTLASLCLFWPLALILIPIDIILIVAKVKDQKSSNDPTNASKKKSTKEETKFEYEKSWLFSYNEKEAYSKLKPIAEEMGYTVFAKVRLLDLLTPTKNSPNYRSNFNKIKAKHVDFVLCDEKLVARYIIELDDSSHERPDRKKRDQFVDQIVESVGYKIIHTNYINESIKEKLK